MVEESRTVAVKLMKRWEGVGRRVGRERWTVWGVEETVRETGGEGGEGEGGEKEKEREDVWMERVEASMGRVMLAR